MPRPGAAAEVTDLRLVVDGADGTPVDVRIHDRDGQARVSVHTADPNYNETLKDRVTELVRDVERNGFRVESVLAPAKTSEGSASGTRRDHSDQPGDQGRGHQDQTGGSDQRQRRHQEQQDEPSWGSDFESVFASSIPSSSGRR
jgi:hypothetical protein